MNRFIPITLLCACAALVFATAPRAEEPANGDKPKADAPAPDQNQNRTRGRGNWGNNGGGNNNTPGGGGGGGAGGIMNLLGNMGGRGAGGGAGGALGMVSRMLGIDIPDPKGEAKVDQLPLGASKRFVLNIPVGGVDNFTTGNGWKMEAVFKMTPEQTKTVDGLRDDYALEEKKLNQEILDAEKALADKVVQLRTKYEGKANELLSGADKESKEKMDALSADVQKKNADIVAETLPLYDTNDMQQGFTMVRALREKTGKIIQDGEDKLIELVPADRKPAIQELLKKQAETRAAGNRGLGGGGQGGAPGGGGMRNRGAGGGGDAVKPPTPPATEKF